jgi:hypothetical protein
LQWDYSLICYQQHRRSYTTEPNADEATTTIHVELATQQPQNAARLRSGTSHGQARLTVQWHHHVELGLHHTRAGAALVVAEWLLELAMRRPQQHATWNKIQWALGPNPLLYNPAQMAAMWRCKKIRHRPTDKSSAACSQSHVRMVSAFT